jgi:hypothetical protein
MKLWKRENNLTIENFYKPYVFLKLKILIYFYSLMIVEMLIAINLYINKCIKVL